MMYFVTEEDDDQTLFITVTDNLAQIQEIISEWFEEE